MQGRNEEEIREVLLREAPAWAAHVPQLRDTVSSGSKSERRPAHTIGALAAALDAITVINPVILAFEDLHSSDKPTADLIAYLARLREPTRLLMICTYRGSGARGDPSQLREIVRELRAHRQCQVLRVHGLSETEISDYLYGRSGAHPVKLAHQMYRRTGGNALFMTAIADQLEALGGTNGSTPDDLGELSVPDNIHDMIEHQIEELSEHDQNILQAASVAATGEEFSSAALAAALDLPAQDQDRIELECEQLTRRVHFLYATEVVQWPDGTIAAGYCFRHSLYQEVLYGRISRGLRARTHLRIARRLETAYGAQTGKIASELAMHFERGGDERRAATYLSAVAESAFGRGVAREALRQIEHALKLIGTVPHDQERLQMELELEVRRSVALTALRSRPSKIEASLLRIAELARDQGGRR